MPPPPPPLFPGVCGQRDLGSELGPTPWGGGGGVPLKPPAGFPSWPVLKEVASWTLRPGRGVRRPPSPPTSESLALIRKRRAGGPPLTRPLIDVPWDEAPLLWCPCLGGGPSFSMARLGRHPLFMMLEAAGKGKECMSERLHASRMCFPQGGGRDHDCLLIFVFQCFTDKYKTI